jgi:hypothetical protein
MSREVDMSTTATTPASEEARVSDPLEAAPRAPGSRTFLHYIRRGNGPQRPMTPHVEAALRNREESAPARVRTKRRGVT